MSKYSSLVPICCLVLVAAVQAVPEGRIVGGSPAMPGQFPYQVSLEFLGEQICGGSIISKTYILTAAHCLFSEPDNYLKRRPRFAASSLSVQAGTSLRGRGGVRIPVAETIVHPSYLSGDWTVDIALVKLSKPLTLSRMIQPIPLSTQNVPDNSKVVICGWGSLTPDEEVPLPLQWLIVEVVPKHICEPQIKRSSDNLLCLAHPKNTGVGFGDSGGPAVVDGRLVGVASCATGRCCGEKPDVYIKVSSYLSWIRGNSDA